MVDTMVDSNLSKNLFRVGTWSKRKKYEAFYSRSISVHFLEKKLLGDMSEYNFQDKF